MPTELDISYIRTQTYIPKQLNISYIHTQTYIPRPLDISYIHTRAYIPRQLVVCKIWKMEITNFRDFFENLTFQRLKYTRSFGDRND